MIYTDQTRKAMRIAYRAHDGQLDKSGVPYIFHPIHVAEQMQDEETTIVALLHDVVEDTEMTLDDIRREGFSEEILEAIRLLTHQKDTPYLAYVQQLKDNPIARAVKLADLRHNSDRSRLKNPNVSLQKKWAGVYQQAIALLEEAEQASRPSVDSDGSGENLPEKSVAQYTRIL